MSVTNKLPTVSKAEQIIWWGCRIALFIWGVWGLFTGYTSDFIQASFAIIFTHLWDIFQLAPGKTFIKRLPAYLQTMLNIFICFGCVVGTTLNSRTDFTGIDLPEHCFAGYLATTGGFILCGLMQGEKHPIKVSVQAMFGLGFGVAILVGWEFYEFTMDRLYGFVMQHGQVPEAYGLTDTMVDLIVGTAGCLMAMFAEAFRKVGLYGKGKEERRKAWREERAEAKKLKAMLKDGEAWGGNV